MLDGDAVRIPFLIRQKKDLEEGYGCEMADTGIVLPGESAVQENCLETLASSDQLKGTRESKRVHRCLRPAQRRSF